MRRHWARGGGGRGGGNEERRIPAVGPARPGWARRGGPVTFQRLEDRLRHLGAGAAATRQPERAPGATPPPAARGRPPTATGPGEGGKGAGGGVGSGPGAGSLLYAAAPRLGRPGLAGVSRLTWAAAERRLWQRPGGPRRPGPAAKGGNRHGSRTCPARAHGAAPAGLAEPPHRTGAAGRPCPRRHDRPRRLMGPTAASAAPPPPSAGGDGRYPPRAPPIGCRKHAPHQ